MTVGMERPRKGISILRNNNTQHAYNRPWFLQAIMMRWKIVMSLQVTQFWFNLESRPTKSHGFPYFTQISADSPCRGLGVFQQMVPHAEKMSSLLLLRLGSLKLQHVTGRARRLTASGRWNQSSLVSDSKAPMWGVDRTQTSMISHSCSVDAASPRVSGTLSVCWNCKGQIFCLFS